MKTYFYIIFSILFISCKNKTEIATPIIQNISESIYASGVIKSKNQYQVYSKLNGLIEKIYFQEGDYVRKGQVIATLYNQSQKLNQENALISANYADINANQGKLKEAKIAVELALIKMQNDSILYERQKQLWSENVGTKLELEQKELLYQNSKGNYESALIKYQDLKRQLEFNSQQSQKNYLISQTITNDYQIKSEIDGLIYSINFEAGEFVSIQTPIAVIGSNHAFTLEMQIDEYDIMKIKTGQKVLVSMDSYKGKVFEAKVSKIHPIMNPKTKSFIVEAEFVQQPESLYPNLSFEANILIQTKQNALLIPRSFLLNDSTVLSTNNEKIKVQIGLKDYNYVEILSGLTPKDQLSKPQP